MIINTRAPRAATDRFYDCKMFLEAWKLGCVNYKTTVASLQHTLSDYRPNGRIHETVQEVYKGTITVVVAAYALEAAYDTGGKV